MTTWQRRQKRRRFWQSSFVSDEVTKRLDRALAGSASGPRAAIVVAADPDGQAVAALWLAQAELAEGVGGHP